MPKPDQWQRECERMVDTYPDLKGFLDTFAAHCGTSRAIFTGQCCKMLKEVIEQQAAMDDCAKGDGDDTKPFTALELLIALVPKLEEDVLMALRFLYHVKAKPVVPDDRYDAAESEFLSRPEVEESALMNPGSDNPSDYPDHIKALAFYLSLMGWQAGQKAGKAAEGVLPFA